MSGDLKRLASGQDWSGYLTFTNLDAVADRLRDMIGDGQLYTWIACYEGLGEYRPEVRTGQTVREIKVDPAGADNRSITVHDSWGVWWISTDAEDRAATYGREPGFYLAYLDITRTYVRIQTRVPAGYRAWWVVAVEGGDRS